MAFKIFLFKKSKQVKETFKLILIQAIIIIILIDTCHGYIFSGYRYLKHALSNDDNKFYIYAVGASTMGGFPFPAQNNIPNTVKRAFEGNINDREIKIIKNGDLGGDLTNQYYNLFWELSLNPPKNGIVFIYSGINENTCDSKLGNATYPLWRCLYSSLTFSSINTYISNKGINKIASNVPIISDIFMDFYTNTYDKYEFFLERIIKLAKKNNLPVVISTLTANRSGFKPFPELHIEDDLHKKAEETILQIKKYIPKKHLHHKIKKSINILKNQYTEIINQSKTHPYYKKHKALLTKQMQIEKSFEKQDYLKAKKDITSLIEEINQTFILRTHPDQYLQILLRLYYLKADILTALEDYDNALVYYKKAAPINRPTCFPRPQMNEVITELSKKYNIPLINAEDILLYHSSKGLLDYEMFCDGHHFSKKGLLLIGMEFAKKTADIFNIKLKHTSLKIKDDDTLQEKMTAALTNAYFHIRRDYINKKNMQMLFFYLNQLEDLSNEN